MPAKAKLSFKTDNRPLFEYSLVSLNNFGLHFERIDLDLYQADPEILAANVATEYEDKFKEKGPIYRIEARFPDKVVD